MPEMDDRVSNRPDLAYLSQVGTAARWASSGRHGLALAAGLALVILAGIVAPGDSPGAWIWTRTLLAWAMAAIGLASVASASSHPEAIRPISPLLTWGSLLLAIAISLTFSPLTATIAVLTLVPLLLAVLARRPGAPAAFWIIATVLTPIWVWTAFDAWDRWLLMLVPLGLVGLVSLEHALRADLAPDGRPHRLAAWIGAIGLAALLLAAALVGDIDTTWVVAGALGAILASAIDLTLVPARLREAAPSLTLPGIALAWLAWAWLAAL
jgi:hypothetical protein